MSFLAMLTLPFDLVTELNSGSLNRAPFAALFFAYLLGGLYALAVGVFTGFIVYRHGTIGLGVMLKVTIILSFLLTAVFFFQATGLLAFPFKNFFSTFLFMGSSGLVATSASWLLLALFGVLRDYSLKKLVFFITGEKE